MTNKNIYEEFCELINENRSLIYELAEGLGGTFAVEEVIWYEPDWKGLIEKENKFRERLKLLMENWAKLQEIKYDNG